MNISIKCKCGGFSGELSGLVPGHVQRVVCYCGDCQAFTRFLGNSKEILDENGGTEVMPVYPSQIKITRGLGNLRSVKLTPDGLIRWYAECCKMPVANTISSRFPFVSLISTIVDFPKMDLSRDEAFGAISFRVHGKYAIGKVPEGTNRTGSIKFFLSVIRFLIKGNIQKRGNPFPFFDKKTGQPISDPLMVSERDYQILRPRTY